MTCRSQQYLGGFGTSCQHLVWGTKLFRYHLVHEVERKKKGREVSFTSCFPVDGEVLLKNTFQTLTAAIRVILGLHVPGDGHLACPMLGSTTSSTQKEKSRFDLRQ